MTRRVHVLGNAGVDLVFRVAQAPRMGETVIARGADRAPGGKGLNQATVAARAGASVRFQAPIGSDPEGDYVRRCLAGEAFHELSLPTRPFATDMSVVIVAESGENQIVSTSDCAESVTEADAEAFSAGLEPNDIILMQGNLSEPATRAAIRVATARGADAWVNLAPYRWSAEAGMPACDLVLNEIEAEQASGFADPAAAARAIQARGAGRVLVTLGGDGCLLVADATTRYFPACPALVRDTTGAGDAFCGVLVAGIARGVPIEAAIAAAQTAAAMTVTRPGAFAALPTAEELVMPTDAL